MANSNMINYYPGIRADVALAPSVSAANDAAVTPPPVTPTVQVVDGNSCQFCCEHFEDEDLQEKYAVSHADVSSTSHKAAKAFEYLLLIATALELFMAVALFIFGLYLKYLREQLSVFTLADESAQSNGIIQLLANIPTFLITVGVILFIFAIIGAAGALRHYVIVLSVYLGFLVIVSLLEFILIGAFVDNKDLIQKTVHDEFAINGTRNYFDDEDLKYVIDYIQSHFGCCGTDIYFEWNNNSYFNCSSANPSIQRCSVPSSCCINDTQRETNAYCGQGVLLASAKNVASTIYTDGCYQHVIDYLNSYEEFCISFIIHVIRKERKDFEYWKATGTLPHDDDGANSDSPPPPTADEDVTAPPDDDQVEEIKLEQDKNA